MRLYSCVIALVWVKAQAAVSWCSERGELPKTVLQGHSMTCLSRYKIPLNFCAWLWRGSQGLEVGGGIGVLAQKSGAGKSGWWRWQRAAHLLGSGSGVKLDKDNGKEWRTCNALWAPLAVLLSPTGHSLP